jgi:hypothetical protein
MHRLQATEQLEAPAARLRMSGMGYDSLFARHKSPGMDIRRNSFEVMVEHSMKNRGRLAGEALYMTTMAGLACSDHLPGNTDGDTS